MTPRGEALELDDQKRKVGEDLDLALAPPFVSRVHGTERIFHFFMMFNFHTHYSNLRDRFI
jgi:hypothetical protein